MNFLRDLWAKIKANLLHLSIVAMGILSMADATTINLIANTLGDFWGHRIASGLLIASGLATMYQNYKKSQ